jgi:hypothetical protein
LNGKRDAPAWWRGLAPISSYLKALHRLIPATRCYLTDAELDLVSGGVTQTNTSTITQTAIATNSGRVTATATSSGTGTGASATAIGAAASNEALVGQLNVISVRVRFRGD